MKPRAVPDPVDALGATLVDLQSRTRALEVVSHRHVNTFGSFYDLTNQTAGALDTPQPVTFDTTVLSYGISVQNGSELTIETPGAYLLAFSLQLHNIGGGGSGENFYVWIRYNGTTYANSASRVLVANGRYDVVTLTFLGESQAPGDFVEIMWEVNNLSIRLESIAASGDRPAVPSVIASLQRVPGRQ
jgi:hypothetical protein